MSWTHSKNENETITNMRRLGRLCRRLGRMKDNAVHTKGETVSTEDLHTYTNLHRQDRECRKAA
jgi:hypothetical protein